VSQNLWLFQLLWRQKILLVFEKLVLRETISSWDKISGGGHWRVRGGFRVLWHSRTGTFDTMVK
jgi:hypothetical protein